MIADFPKQLERINTSMTPQTPSTDHVSVPRWQFDQMVSTLLQIAQQKAHPPEKKPKFHKFVPYKEPKYGDTPKKKKDPNYSSVYYAMTGVT